MIALDHLDKGTFAQIEPLLTAGFKSKHRYLMNKTAETWNAIVKDEEELECSDSLKAIITSLRPSVDLVLPGVEESSGEFGAQAPLFIESQDDLSFIALSSAKSSRQDLEQALPAPVTLSKIASKGPITRNRRRDATPDAAPGKSSKRTTTPRLRHDNSQIQFAPIESSPLAEHSQNLTERQKEVRQRQKDDAGLYTKIRSSPRTRSQAILEEKSKKSPVPSNARRLQATPERATSYEDFITSTPTPRRGQALHLADDNDPPSSPPEPRRYPLLSEIQTRSKARNSLENWEFSSPPGTPATPATEHQQICQDAELPHISLTDDSTQNRVTDNAEAEVDDMEIIPSSAVAEHDIEMIDQTTKLEDESSELSAIPSDPPATPPPRDTSAILELQETPKSGEDEFVDARSSPERPSPDRVLVVAQEAPSPTKDTSFYLSEGDESSMMRFVVELESRRCNLPFDKIGSASPDKKDRGPTQECIEVSSPSEKKKRDAKRSASPIIPSTPMDAVADVSRSASPAQNESQDPNKSQSKRKRRRSIRYSETRRKRRRSAGPSVTEQAEESQPTIAEDKPTEAPSVRRSSRRLAGKNSQDVESQGSPSKKRAPPPTMDTSSKPADGRDGGDTDEELMSQLVTESFAASQNQAQQKHGTSEECDVDNSMELVRTAEEGVEADMEKSGGESVPEEGDSGASRVSGLMGILRGGLDELRGAALSREEVYQLEDILMDMKRELFAAERRGRA